MAINFKTALLTGTALVAVGFSLPAHAAGELAIDTNNSNDSVYETDDNNPLTWTPHTARDLRVDDDATVGLINGEAIGNGNTTVAAIVGAVTGKTLTLSETAAGDDAAETATVDGNISVGTSIAALNLAILSSTDNDEALTIDVNGSINLGTGTITVTSQDTNSTATLNVSGDITSGTITLNENSSAATLVLDGATAQAVSGAIAAGNDNEGDITIKNAAGVTFASTIGASGTEIDNILIAGSNADAAATFKDDVYVNTAIVLGDGANTNTNTLTLDSSVASFSINGPLNGTAGDTDNIVVSGGNTVTTSGAWTALDAVSVSGTGTILSAGASMTSTAFTVGSGATLQTSGAATLTGTIDGAGTLDVNAATTVAGNIGGTTPLTLVDVAAGITLGINDNLIATTTNLSGLGTGTLAFDGTAHTVTTNVTTATNGAGAITVATGNVTTTITGNIGTSDAKLATMDVAGGGSANLVTTTGNLYVNAITVNDADTLQFLGNSAQTVSGTIADGIVTVGNGTTTSDVTFSGALTSIASANVSAAATARFDANATVTGAMTNAGTAYVANGTTLTAGSFAGAGTYQIEASDAGTIGTLETTDFGKLASGGAIDLAGETVNFNVTGNITTGTIASVFVGGGAAVDAASVTDNSYRYSFDLQSNLNDFDIVVSKVSAASVGLTTSNDNALTILDTLENSTDTQIAAAVDNVAAATTQVAANEVIESVLPSVDAGAVGAIFDASVQSLDVTETRLASLRNGGETGMVAGEMTNGMQAWIQAFGKLAQQDDRSGVNGYDADTYGIAVGVDTANAIKGGTVGMALSYANTEVDSDNANTTSSDIDSYQISLYGDYDINEQTYVAGTLAYANNSIEQVRHNVGAVTGLTASADYDSNQVIAYAEAGRHIPVTASGTLTPSVLAHYQHISVDDYTETGAGGLNLSSNNDSIDVFELGLGAEMAWDLQDTNGAKVRPAVNVGYRYDVIGDSVDASSTFAGGGAAFTTQGVDPAQGKFNVGASIGYAMDNNWELTADYNLDIKEDYDAHTGYVRAGYKFQSDLVVNNFKSPAVVRGFFFAEVLAL